MQICNLFYDTIGSLFFCRAAEWTSKLHQRECLQNKWKSQLHKLVWRVVERLQVFLKEVTVLSLLIYPYLWTSVVNEPFRFRFSLVLCLTEYWITVNNSHMDRVFYQTCLTRKVSEGLWPVSCIALNIGHMQITVSQLYFRLFLFWDVLLSYLAMLSVAYISTMAHRPCSIGCVRNGILPIAPFVLSAEYHLFKIVCYICQRVVCYIVVLVLFSRQHSIIIVENTFEIQFSVKNGFPGTKYWI